MFCIRASVCSFKLFLVADNINVCHISGLIGCDRLLDDVSNSVAELPNFNLICNYVVTMFVDQLAFHVVQRSWEAVDAHLVASFVSCNNFPLLLPKFLAYICHQEFVQSEIELEKCFVPCLLLWLKLIIKHLCTVGYQECYELQSTLYIDIDILEY